MESFLLVVYQAEGQLKPLYMQVFTAMSLLMTWVVDIARMLIKFPTDIYKDELHKHGI